MDWIKKITLISALAGLVCVVVSCRISMGLAPISSIDYSKVKTITIAEFPNRAEYVYAPMTTEFNQKLKDMFYPANTFAIGECQRRSGNRR